MYPQFDMLARDMDSADWQRVTQAPVRAAQDRFLEAGLQRAILEPWNRRFSVNGRPAQPESSDKVTFMAKVCEEHVEPLLKASGHNHVYLTPRDFASPLQLYGWEMPAMRLCERACRCRSSWAWHTLGPGMASECRPHNMSVFMPNSSPVW